MVMIEDARTLTLTLRPAGDDYRADEPMLHSRAHLLKKLEIINSTGQLL